MKGNKAQLLIKALSPKFVVKAMETFDSAIALVVGLCWAAAAVMIAFTLYTVNLTVKAKHDAETALAVEPMLPKIVHKKADAREIQPLVDRLQKRYPGLVIGYKGNLQVTAVEGAKFHDWLNALSYFDSVAPQFRWNLLEFCVGKCGAEPMQATLAGEKIMFEKPQQETKN